VRSIALFVRIFLCAIVAFALFAQTRNARLEGTVQDQTNAVIPNATVSAVNTQTQVSVQTTSGADGHFIFPDLQPGFYNVTVTIAGFRTAVMRAVELTVAATVDVDIKLEVGQASESIEVLASAATVQTTESQISTAIPTRSIDILPQLGRGPIILAITAGAGVQIDVRAGQDASYSRINGLRQGSNNATLDGIDVNDSVAPRLGLSMTANNSDSVEEFRLVSQGGKAEYGRSAGGQVQLITRSGTNQFHGNAFDYLRNTDLNANDFFNNQSGGTVPKFIRNIYGGSFGGPIIHDKTFIFGNFQGTRTRQEVIENRIVPTLNMKQGLFTYVANGATQTFNIAGADPLHRGIDPAVAKILAMYPAPNSLDQGDGLNTANFRFNNPVQAIEDQFTIRGDHHINNNLVVFLRWSWQRNSSTDNLNGAEATFPGQLNGTQGGHRWGFGTGADWTLTPSLVNEFRIGHQSASVDFLRPNRPQGPTVVWNGSALALTDYYFTGFAQGRNSPVNDLTDNLTKIWGKHTFKLGGNIRYTTQYGYNYANVWPNVSMNVANGNNVPAIQPAGLSSAALTNFQAMYNILLGRIDQVTETFYSDLQTFQPSGTPRVRNFLLREHGYFFQDDWRVSNRLTLNVGWRWEYFAVPSESNGLQGTVANAGSISAYNTATNLTVQKSTNWYGNDFNNFAPRIGFAYDVKGDGKTAIRGNFGIFYDRAIGAAVSLADTNTPGFSQAVPIYPNQNGTDVRFSDQYPLPAAPSAPQLTLPVTRSTSIVLFNPNLRTGYVESYSFTVQRQLASNTILQVGYVGNRGVKLFMNEDVNQPKIYTNGFIQDFLQMQAYVANNSTVVPASNVFVKLFGTPAAAVSTVGATNISQGRVGTVVNSIDRNQYTKFAAAGIPDTYFRNYPQYNQVILGTNDGRSYYDSMQATLRRTAGALQFIANYTWSKAMDNISAEGNGFTAPIDTFNPRLNRALSDFNRPHSFNVSAFYTLPVGRGQWIGNSWPRFVDTALGGWQLGGLWITQSGQPFSVSSQRATTAISGVGNSYAQYTGTDYGIGSVQRLGNGVFFFTPQQIAQFTYPAAGQIGNGGRNVFYNPLFNEMDASLVKRFKLTERQSVSFRAEAYNVFNHPNFGFAAAQLNINNISYNTDGSVNMAKTSFGKFTQTLGTQVGGSSARTLQLALRYDF